MAKPLYLKKKFWKAKLEGLLEGLGYDNTHWARVVQYQESFAWIGELGPENLDILEISAGPTWPENFSFKSYTPTQYPEFDICEATLPQKFDLIIADHVFPHLLWPYRAAENVREMLKDGGHFWLSSSFMIKVNASPEIDCCRWTERGLKNLLVEAGFDSQRIRTGSWGNRACVKANFNHWAKRGWFSSLKNEPGFPVSVWGMAQK